MSTIHRVTSRLAPLFEWFIPQVIRDAGTDAVRRAKILLTFWLAITIWAPVYMVFYYSLGCTPAAIAIGVSGLFALAIPLILRRTGSFVLVGNFMALDLFWVLIFLAFYTGGYRGPAVVWTVAIPMVAVCTAGRTWGVVWTGVSILAVFWLHTLERMGHPFTPAMDPRTMELLHAVSLASLLLVVCSLAWLYDAIKGWALDLVLDREKDLGAALRRTEEVGTNLATVNESLQTEIIDRQAAEDKLRESNKHLRQLNERLDATAREIKGLMRGVVEDRVYRARFANRSLARCWEVKHCKKTSCPAHGDEDTLRCWEVAGTFCKGRVQGEFARKLKDCRKCEVYQAARRDSLCDLGETFNDMIAILEDRQRALGNALDEAKAATEAKGEFLANMSHEIRTPMTAILGFIDLIEEGCEHACDFGREHYRDHLDTIARNAEYLLQIINDILDLSKIEAGKLEVEKIAFSPANVVAEVRALMLHRASQEGLYFKAEFDGPVPETIQGDARRLHQILVNLSGNAVKFTKSGGIRLVTRLLPEREAGPAIVFDVIDTGIGMTREQMEGLFKAFAQADTSTTRRFGGTGLGLTISQRLAEMLGGTISVDSKPGEGSRFRLILPTGPLDGVKLVESPTVVLERKSKKTVATPGVELDCRLLLAEDGPDNQRLISHILKKAGAEVSVVENGRLAVDAALDADREGAPFDVILMDMQMPVMDGYDATRLLRREGYGGLIIALTAHSMPGDRKKCIDAGCNDYATKPIDRGGLLEMIRHRLQTRVSAAAR